MSRPTGRRPRRCEMAHVLRREQVPRTDAEPSLGELFSDLTRETTTLVREEINLARVEMSHKAARMGKDVGFLVAGGAVAYAGFLAVVATLIIALAYAMPWWLAALIVGLLVLAIGAFLVMRGLD